MFGTVFAIIRTASFPENAPEIERKEVTRSVMKILRQLIFMALVVIGFSMTAMAQRDDDKNRPKKPDPPQIVVPDKDRPKDRPKNDNNNNNNRPKKPQDAVSLTGNRTEISSV